MMNLWHELPSGPNWPEIIYVVVEIPKKSRNKYEYDWGSSAWWTRATMMTRSWPCPTPTLSSASTAISATCRCTSWRRWSTSSPFPAPFALTTPDAS